MPDRTHALAASNLDANNRQLRIAGRRVIRAVVKKTKRKKVQVVVVLKDATPKKASAMEDRAFVKRILKGKCRKIRWVRVSFRTASKAKVKQMQRKLVKLLQKRRIIVLGHGGDTWRLTAGLKRVPKFRKQLKASLKKGRAAWFSRSAATVVSGKNAETSFDPKAGHGAAKKDGLGIIDKLIQPHSNQRGRGKFAKRVAKKVRLGKIKADNGKKVKAPIRKIKDGQAIMKIGRKTKKVGKAK